MKSRNKMLVNISKISILVDSLGYNHKKIWKMKLKIYIRKIHDYYKNNALVYQDNT